MSDSNCRKWLAGFTTKDRTLQEIPSKGILVMLECQVLKEVVHVNREKWRTIIGADGEYCFV